MQTDWPYPFDVVWLAERGQLLLELSTECDVFVTTTEQTPRTRCFHGSGAIPAAPRDTVRFTIDGREFAITLVPDLGATGHAQLAVLSGEEKMPLKIATFDGPASDTAEAVRRLYQIGHIERLRAIWQTQIDTEENPIKLGPAQLVWPFGGRRVVKITKPTPSAQTHYPPYVLSFSTTDVAFRHDRRPLPTGAAVVALAWRSVVADDDASAHAALRKEFLRQLGVSDTTEERRPPPWPLRNQREYARERSPLIDVEGRFEEDVDVGDIVVVCACSLPGWKIDLVAAEQVATAEQVESLSAREISPSSYGRPDVHFQVLCWRVEPDRLAPQKWSDLDQRALPELKRRIGVLADDVWKLRAEWDDDVRKELSSYPGYPADFEAAAVHVTGLADTVGAGRIFELGRVNVASHEDIVFWLERLPIDQLRRLMSMSGLPIDNIARLLPINLSDAPRAGVEDWRRHEDDASQLCATLRELWDRLGERDPYNRVFAPGPNLRTFAQLPDRIREAELLLSDVGGRQALRRALQIFRAASLPVEQIRPIHVSVQKFAAALEAAIRAANTIIVRLSESLPDARDVELTAPTLMAATEATEKELTTKLPEPSQDALRVALKSIANAAALSEKGKGRLRGAILALAEQGRRVTAIARHFLDHLELAPAEAYVRSTRFMHRGDDWSVPSDPALTPDEEVKLTRMLKDFRSFVPEDARPWVGRVLAIRRQLAQEERLRQALDELSQAPPPDLAGPSGKKASNALRNLLVTDPGDPGKLAEALDELSA